MNKSVKLFFSYLAESVKEIKDNLNIYWIYIAALCLVSIVEMGLDSYFPKEEFALRLFSKILFSIVPLLILSKILYVIKIRNTGNAEYARVMWRFIKYNFYYFSLLVLSLCVCVGVAALVSYQVNKQMAFVIFLSLAAIFIGIVLFYSLSPYVAVFNDESDEIFAESKLLTSKSIFLVIINHVFWLFIPMLLAAQFLIKNPQLKIAAAIFFSIPQAIFGILTVLTTTKIYMYLTTRD